MQETKYEKSKRKVKRKSRSFGRSTQKRQGKEKNNKGKTLMNCRIETKGSKGKNGENIPEPIVQMLRIKNTWIKY